MIAILGTGPAGLLAAHAVGLTGKPIALFGTGEKSVISGAQFLHRAIPDLTDTEPDFHISYGVHGDAATYQRKVYGDLVPPFVSFSGVEDGKVQDAWSLVHVYERLWEFLGDSMNKVVVTPEWLEENIDEFQAIVSTIPLPALCKGNHHFASVNINVGASCILAGIPDNTIVYDGTPHRSWYRCSKINGVGGTEWGGNQRRPPPIGGPLRTVSKPIRHNCNCWPNLITVGRYGAWKKGLLAHDGFFGTLRGLNEARVIDIGPTEVERKG